jgi:signal transduction histidine kinase
VFTSRAQNKGIHINLEVVDDLELLVDRRDFQQLFANLISNSIDACQRRGRIRVRASEATSGSVQGVRVTVADNGHGINLADRQHVFEPFFTTKKTVGTGLGLWLCKEIVEKYGGSIRIRSNVMPGRSWTAASVFLPLTASERTPIVKHSLKNVA